jgi:hypothetical protein
MYKRIQLNARGGGPRKRQTAEHLHAWHHTRLDTTVLLSLRISNILSVDHIAALPLGFAIFDSLNAPRLLPVTRRIPPLHRDCLTCVGLKTPVSLDHKEIIRHGTSSSRRWTAGQAAAAAACL